MAILSAERKGDEDDVRSEVLTLHIAEGGGAGEVRRKYYGCIWYGETRDSRLLCGWV